MAYVFNTDLLLPEADLAKARELYPRLAFALDNPALREAFSPIDRRANLSKTRSRRWGVAAVFLATLALMLAAAEVLYHHADEHLVRMLAGVGALAGIASVLIGVFGVMFRERKIQWLKDRLATERLRQFHFQYFVAHIGEAMKAAGDEAARAGFIQKRKEAFDAFWSSLQPRLGEELKHVVEAEEMGDGLFFGSKPEAIDEQNAVLDEYYKAYEKLRFTRQIDYCNLILREKGGLWKHAPISQAKILGGLAFFCVLAILALHALIFFGALGEIHWMKSPMIHVAAIWAAIIALSARTLEDGFQPETEIERMRQYRLSLTRIYDRFKAAPTHAEKYAAMMDLEKLSYEEMVLFLKTNHEAQFVM